MEDTKILIKLDRENNILYEFHIVSVPDIAELLLRIARDDKHFALALGVAYGALIHLKDEVN